MKQRQLGQGGPNVSAIGFGSMSLSGFFGPTDLATSLRCLSAVVDHGIDWVDTADIYGQGLSEEILGKFLRDHPNAFRIASKFGIRTKPVRGFDNAPDYIDQCLEQSMRRLGVDYIDLYYVHRREADRPIEEVVTHLAGLIKAGKIGGYGLSEISPTTLRRAHAVHPCMAVQNEYSLWTRLPDLGLIRTCAELGVAFVPFSPLARGMLTDAQPKLTDMSGPDLRIKNPRFIEPNFSDNLAMIKPFQNWAADHGYSTSALALAWVLHRGEHLLPIPATRTAAHLAQWVRADQITLSDAQMAEIEQILPVGWAYGDRYSPSQYIGPETYA